MMDEIVGKKYGRLLAIKHCGIDLKTRDHFIECECSCGKIKVFRLAHLKNSHTKSCGCLRSEACKERLFRHGQSQVGKRTPEYIAWKNMKGRCGNEKRPDYKHYGGRGIRVCSEWQESFDAFFNSVGLRPTPKHSIDRINNDQGYFPENVRWATKKEQVTNRRKFKRRNRYSKKAK